MRTGLAPGHSFFVRILGKRSELRWATRCLAGDPDSGAAEDARRFDLVTRLQRRLVECRTNVLRPRGEKRPGDAVPRSGQARPSRRALASPRESSPSCSCRRRARTCCGTSPHPPSTHCAGRTATHCPLAPPVARKAPCFSGRSLQWPDGFLLASHVSGRCCRVQVRRALVLLALASFASAP